MVEKKIKITVIFCDMKIMGNSNFQIPKSNWAIAMLIHVVSVIAFALEQG